MGREDHDLDDVGREQVQHLTEALDRITAGRALAGVISSPLMRARHTIQPFADLRGADVRIEPDLAEMDYGPTIDSSRPDVRLHLRSQHRCHPLPGGESLHDVWVRAQRLTDALHAASAADGALVVVGHYRINQLLAGSLLGRSFEASVDDPPLRAANASVHRIDLGADTGNGVCLLWQHTPATGAGETEQVAW